MPVRKIPKNYLCVTGSFASRKNGRMIGFESILEKEYMLLLDFDESVESVDCFEEQPVIVPLSNVPKGYTPDILVRYRVDPATGRSRMPLLTEVKHTDDLKKNAEKYAPKFAAAKIFAAERDWEYRITTELDIRTPRLANLKFLREYRNIVLADEDAVRIQQIITESGGSISMQLLLQQLATTDDERLYWLPPVWNMVLTRRLITDLDIPIGDNVSFCLPEDHL